MIYEDVETRKLFFLDINAVKWKPNKYIIRFYLNPVNPNFFSLSAGKNAPITKSIWETIKRPKSPIWTRVTQSIPTTAKTEKEIC